MKVIGNIDIYGKASGAFAEYDDYPTDPKVGTWAVIHQNLMMCSQVGDLPVWIPLSPMKDTKVFEQETPANRWVVDHELGSENVIIQCFDSANNVIQPNSISPIDSMSTEVVLPEAMTGKVVVMFGFENGNRTTNGVGGTDLDVSFLANGFDVAETTNFPIGFSLVGWVGVNAMGKVTRVYQTRNTYCSYAADTYGGNKEGDYLEGEWVVVEWSHSYGNVDAHRLIRVK